MHTLIARLVQSLPAHIEMAIAGMDASTFYTLSRLAIAALIVAALAMTHWRRRRTWLPLVVIVELACLAAMIFVAMAFNVLDFYDWYHADPGMLVLPLAWAIAIVLSHAFDGLATAVKFGHQRLADRGAVAALVNQSHDVNKTQAGIR